MTQTPTLDPTATPMAPTSFKGKPILLATDGTTSSEGAVRVARLLAGAFGGELHPLAVLEAVPYPLPAVDPAVAVAAETYSMAELRTQLQESVARQLGALLGPQAPAPSVVDGPVVSTIEHEAERRGAALMVLGLRPHDRIDRLVRDETTLRVARAAAIPMLAVVPTLQTIPRTIVVALDFSRAAARAARDAAALLPAGGTIILAHVRPPATLNAEDAEGYGVIYDQGVKGALARLQATLAVPPDVTVETVRLVGGPAPALLQFATERGADCIALGSHRHGFVSRMLLGSVAQDLLRAAKVSLFITPPEAA